MFNSLILLKSTNFMKKIILSSLVLALSLTTFAQLPYETELRESQFNDATVVISKSDKCKWSLGAAALGTVISTTKTNYFVVALPTVGLPEKVSFKYSAPFLSGLIKGTISMYESTDHENWGAAIWSKEVQKAFEYGEEGSSALKSTTRYLKFEYNGPTVVYIYGITVNELKELSVSTDAWPFATAYVDDPVETKTVAVKWTNVVANVTSTNPAFTVSTNKIGEKNKKDQTTNLVITYNHDNYGDHSGQIIIEGEDRKAVINVTGKTIRYPQTLYWTETLGTYKTTDNILLNAYTNQGQPVMYASSDSAIAIVDENARVQVKCSGTVDITAYHPGDRKYEPTDKITKTLTLEKATPIVAITANNIVYGQPISECNPTETLGKVAGTIQFRGIDPETILDANTYNIKVVFVPADDCIYNEVERTISVKVDKANQSITWNQNETDLYVGDELLLTANASSGLPLTYAFTACNISIDENVMTGVEEGEVLVIAFQAGNNNYYPSTVAMQNFEVYGKYTPTAERQIMANPSVEELEANGYKFYHNGEVYISYQGKVYTADGKIVK